MNKPTPLDDILHHETFSNDHDVEVVAAALEELRIKTELAEWADRTFHRAGYPILDDYRAWKSKQESDDAK